MIAGIFLIGAVLFGLAYRIYGRRLARSLNLDDSRPTPAHTQRDGVDYVPTANPVLFGHHFSSIAGAGPIVGPVLAGLAFGWLPAALWIVLGAILVGGVHDFTAMVASIRHRGQSIGQLCRTLLNPTSYLLFLLFVFFALIYVIIVFLDITATTFAPVAAQAGAAVAEAAQLQLREGGTVASASLFYIVLAALFGLSVYRFRLPLGPATLIFVPLVFAGLWLGSVAPLPADAVPAVFGQGKYFWTLVLLLYCFFAAVLPVWILLQPRDYLSSFLLYACVGGGALGLLAAGAAGRAPLAYPAFIGWHDPALGALFPALFVTIACGAVSGFHAIVSSGTSAKQLRAESSARVVGYGAMLVEGVVGLIALSTVMVLSEKTSAQPLEIFANGLGRFLNTFGLPVETGRTFGLLAISTFVLTTLDTCTRLARFLVHELFGLDNRLGFRALSTLAVLVVPALMVFREIPGPGGAPMPAWKAIWPAFGASNQLLAALTLLVVYVWMRRQGRRAWFVGLPALFMCIVTLTALAQLTWRNLFQHGSGFIGGISAVLLALAVVVVVNAAIVIFLKPAPEKA